MKRILALILAVMMCAALFTACGKDNSATSDTNAPAPNSGGGGGESGGGTSGGGTGGGSAQQSPAPGQSGFKQISIGSTYNRYAGHFDPTSMLSDNYNCTMIMLCYDNMFYMAPDGSGYVSDIFAEANYDPSAPKLSLTLRDDVYFSNGDQMTGEDIAYTMWRLAQIPRSFIMLGVFDIDNSYVEADGMTYVIPFHKEFSPWAMYLSSVGVVNKSWVDANGGENFDWTDPNLVCGSGPYQPVEYKVDTYTVFDKRGDYWQQGRIDAAYYDRITVYAYSDTTTLMVDYENGVINMVLDLPYTDYNRIVAANGALGTAVKFSSNSVSTLVMGIEFTPELQDINLRKAIVYGTDTQTMADLAFGTLGGPSTGFLAQSLPQFVPGYTYQYDPELAKQIVDENGLAGTTLKFVCDGGVNAKMAEVFQYNMEQIGIVIDLEIYDEATCIQYWGAPGGTAFQFDGGVNANTDNDAFISYILLNGGTMFLPCMLRGDPHWNELYDTGTRLSDPAARKDVYAEMQEIQYGRFSELPICEWYLAYCYDDTVASAQILNFILPDLRWIVPA